MDKNNKNEASISLPIIDFRDPIPIVNGTVTIEGQNHYPTDILHLNALINYSIFQDSTPPDGERE